MQEVAVSVRNLDYRYSDHLSYSFSILDNITFTANESDILGIIGPNGLAKAHSLDAYLDYWKTIEEKNLKSVIVEY
jgi:ABC-type Mn2+/Zn2+ transport system ATPase subunit